MRQRQRGHMGMGLPFAIMAILAALLLSEYWADLPGWLQGGALLVTVAIAALSAWCLLQPSWPAAGYDRDPDD